MLRRGGEALLGVSGNGGGGDAGNAGLPPVAFADDDRGHTAAVAGEKHLGAPFLFSHVFAGAATAYRHVTFLFHGFLLLASVEVCFCCRPKPRSYSHLPKSWST